MDKANIKALRNELSSIIKINFRGIDTGYEKIEEAIVKSGKVPSFTAEQWKAIVSSKFDYLFQHGSPHISWNTYRSYIYNEIERTCKCVSTCKYSRTWTMVTESTYITHSGVRLQLIKEKPYYPYDTFGFHPTQYQIKVC